jgi:hypothetical protein
MCKRHRPGLIVDGPLTKPLKRPLFREHKLQRVDEARFTIAVWCKNRQAPLSAEIERLG